MVKTKLLITNGCCLFASTNSSRRMLIILCVCSFCLNEQVDVERVGKRAVLVDGVGVGYLEGFGLDHGNVGVGANDVPQLHRLEVGNLETKTKQEWDFLQ